MGAFEEWTKTAWTTHQRTIREEDAKRAREAEDAQEHSKRLKVTPAEGSRASANPIPDEELVPLEECASTNTNALEAFNEMRGERRARAHVPMGFSPAPIIQSGVHAEDEVSFVYCGWCGNRTHINLCRLGKKEPPTWKCKCCNTRLTQLWRLFGSWPPAGIDISEEDQIKFLSDLQTMTSSKKIEAFSEHFLEQFEVQLKSTTWGGEFLPLKVWESRGFDIAAIESQTTPENKMLHPVLGDCYRVETCIKKDKHVVGAKRLQVLQALEERRSLKHALKDARAKRQPLLRAPNDGAEHSDAGGHGEAASSKPEENPFSPLKGDEVASNQDDDDDSSDSSDSSESSDSSDDSDDSSSSDEAAKKKQKKKKEKERRKRRERKKKKKQEKARRKKDRARRIKEEKRKRKRRRKNNKKRNRNALRNKRSIPSAWKRQPKRASTS